jgi:hypothetical protein
LTKFISFYARRNNLLAVIFLVFGTSIFLIPTAQAAYGNTSVICANPAGEQRTFQIGWDNSNQFFADKGYIPAFYCTGGYALPYNIYVSDTLNGGALGYYNGVVTSSNPTPVEPSPSPSPSETVTATPEPSPSETATPTPSPSSSPEPSPTPSATPEPSPSASSVQETQTSQVETPTVTPMPTETSTVPSDTSTVLSDTATIVAPVDGSTATSQPEPVAPTPPVVPVVIPDPVEEPVVVPEEEEPTPEPEPTEEPEAPVEEEVEEEVVPEEEPKEELEEELEEESEEEIIVPEEETVVLDNGVVLTQEQAVAVALLQDPAALLQELFTDPGAALAALSQVGADMSPEAREESEKVIISAVIAGNIATQAAASAGAVAAMRRKP